MLTDKDLIINKHKLFIDYKQDWAFEVQLSRIHTKQVVK